MTCAGCDPKDCPQDAWHLHVTVLPHWSWSLSDVASALRRDVERHGVRPIVVTNHFRDPARSPYKELIPTKHFRGSEADASREIFRMGVLLNNAGWRVKRLKIEGDARSMRIPEGRALYYEAHVKNPSVDLGFPRSTNAKGDVIQTIRKHVMRDVRDSALNAYADRGVCPLLRIEAAVLDTNPQLDEEWINE
jgi:hypothetical protein